MMQQPQHSTQQLSHCAHLKTVKASVLLIEGVPCAGTFTVFQHNFLITSLHAKAGEQHKHTPLAWCCYPTSLKPRVTEFHVSVENMTAISHLKWKHLLRQWDCFLILQQSFYSISMSLQSDCCLIYEVQHSRELSQHCMEMTTFYFLP